MTSRFEAITYIIIYTLESNRSVFKDKNKTHKLISAIFEGRNMFADRQFTSSMIYLSELYTEILKLYNNRNSLMEKFLDGVKNSILEYKNDKFERNPYKYLFKSFYDTCVNLTNKLESGYYNKRKPVKVDRTMEIIDLFKDLNIPEGIAQKVAKYDYYFVGIRTINLIGNRYDTTDILVINENKVVSVSQDNSMTIWNLETNNIDTYLTEHTAAINCVASLPGERFVSGSQDNTLKIWNLYSKRSELTLTGHEGPIRCILVLSKRHIISGSSDRTLRLWNTKTGICEFIFKGHTGGITCIDRLDEDRFVTGSEDYKLMVWNIKTKIYQNISVDNNFYITHIKVINADTIVYSFANVIRIWYIPDNSTIANWTKHNNRITALEVMHFPHGTKIISGSEDKTLVIWNLYSFEFELKGHNTRIKNIKMLPDGNIATSATLDDLILIWDPLTGERLKTLQRQGHYTGNMAILNDGRIIAGSYAKSLKIWE